MNTPRPAMSVPTSVLGLEQNEHLAITVDGPGAGSIAAIPSLAGPVSSQTIMRQASLDKAWRHRALEGISRASIPWRSARGYLSPGGGFRRSGTTQPYCYHIVPLVFLFLV